MGQLITKIQIWPHILLGTTKLPLYTEGSTTDYKGIVGTWYMHPIPFVVQGAPTTHKIFLMEQRFTIDLDPSKSQDS